MGALIVVENKIHLNDVIATGTRVDGIISQPLIENIFEPNTPLLTARLSSAGIASSRRHVCFGCRIRRAWGATWVRAIARVWA